ncbi:MAG: peptidoglycan-binding domain-containing protein [Ilumatobacteraceae bacterium]
MSDLEALARREAQLIREEAALIADTEDAWQALPSAAPLPTPLVLTAGRRRANARVLVAVAALVVVVVIAAAVTWRRDARPSVVQSPPGVTVAGTVSTPTTVSTSPAASSTAPPVVPAPPRGLTVSVDAPPPLLTPEVFAELDLDDDGTVPSVAIAQAGIVAVIDGGASLAVVAWDGSRRDVPLSEPTSSLLAVGPGDVAYGITGGPEPMDMTVDAYALTGPLTGQVVGRTPVDPNRFVELPSASVGHGPNGLVHRLRSPGDPVAPYVDPSGATVTWPEAPPLITIDDDTVRSTSGAVWPLVIGRHPASPTPYEGPSAPAPAADGAAIYWTALGPPEDPDVDDPEPTIGVIATLHPDGTATWQQLPAGWNVAAADVDGAVLSSTATGRLQLARFIPADPTDPSSVPTTTAVNEPTITTATAPDGSTSLPVTCDPNDRNDFQEFPLRRCDQGYGVLWVRNALVARGLLDGSADQGSPLDFSALLDDAVRRFQRENGLEVDGLVGRHTWFALYPEYLNVGPDLAEFDDDANGRIEPGEVLAMGDSNAPCEPTVDVCPPTT